MTLPTVHPRRLRFGAFEVNLDTGELRKGGTKIRLQEQPFQVLCCLLERSGGLVTREELREKLWGNDTFVDFEHGLNAAINRLRDCLCDSAETPRFIETLPRRGYRFLHPVEVITTSAFNSESEIGRLASSKEDPFLVEVQKIRRQFLGTSAFPDLKELWHRVTVLLAPDRYPSHANRHEASLLLEQIEQAMQWSANELQTLDRTDGKGSSAAGIGPPKWRKRLPLLATATAVLLIIGIAARLAQRQRPFMAAIRSIAVLPLKNLSGDPEQEHFAEGMTDVLITDLARASALRVISHTTSNSYRDTQKSLPQIAKELNVDAIVEGTIMRSGSRVRISVQLIRAVDDRHLWADSYEGDLGDILLLQNRVASDIARKVNARLTFPNQVRPVDPAAYDAYLWGRYFLDKRKIEAARRSAEYFQQAVSIDPSYAPAYAGLAEALVSVSLVGSVHLAEVMPQALAAAKRAVELDPNCGEAHTALGFIDAAYAWDWAAADRELRLGIELSPSDSLAEHYYAVYLDAANRPEEAIAHMRRALELDPFSFLMNRHLGSTLYYGRHYDEALHQLRRAAEMQPNSAGVIENWATWIYEQKGMKDEAVHADLMWLEGSGETRAHLNYYQRTYQRSGWKGYWQARIKRLAAHSDEQCNSYDLAVSYLRLGNRDLAFSWLNWAADLRCLHTIWLRVDPLFDDIRTDRRYHDLLRRMNLPE